MKAITVDWWQGNNRKVHFVGVGGSGMRGLATLLSAAGWDVSGSDRQLPTSSRIVQACRGGIFWQPGESVPQNPQPSLWQETSASRWLQRLLEVEALVYSPAVPEQHVERRWATARGIPTWSLPQVIGHLLQTRHGLGVAGTHGKTTTSAMLASIFRFAGRYPSAWFGGELRDTGESSWLGRGPEFVVECCEFSRSFWNYHLEAAIVLNLEHDHFDCYPDEASHREAYAKFLQRVHATGFVLLPIREPSISLLAEDCAARVLTWGWEQPADWWAGDVRCQGWASRCRVFHRETFAGELFLSLPGRYVLEQALVAAACACEWGIPFRTVQAALREFAGVKRRFECLGSWRGVTLVDDYAHHASSLAVVLDTARTLFGRRRLCCAFQPHQINRTLRLWEAWPAGLRQADRVWVLPVFAARETGSEAPAEVSQRLVRYLRSQGIDADQADSLDQLQQVLDDELRPGDVLLTLGAGDIGQVQHAITRRILRHPAAQRTASALHLAEGGGASTIPAHAAQCG
ncbi:MAG: UDP-N-acetylmuramate--L-alanine ligase [Planctomycetaceae bacterium]|nr:MAG: UDP-N-acetylmuramate--L-alanine ligase [Planctomycetaceae bacterium]